MVAAAGGDVAVDAVVGRGDLAVGEPGPVWVGDAAGERLGGAAQGARRPAVPVQLVGVVPPEGLGVAQGELVYGVLGVRHGLIAYG